MEKSDLGNRILMYRAKHNLTQRQMAILLGEHHNAICWLETGKHQPHKTKEIRITLKMNELEGKDENNV